MLFTRADYWDLLLTTVLFQGWLRKELNIPLPGIQGISHEHKRYIHVSDTKSQRSLVEEIRSFITDHDASG